MFQSKLILLLIMGMLSGMVQGNTAPKVAIIGAGIGGASTAYFTKNLFESSLEMDVYEKGKIGGRLQTVEIQGREYECGGSIIHPLNMYMVNFTEKLGLKKRQQPEETLLGLFDGEKMVFEGGHSSVVTILKLLWHYGYDAYKINGFVEGILEKFSRIYKHQSNEEAFTSVENLLASMSADFPDLLHKSIEDFMLENGFHNLFINQLVMGALKTNYGQTPKLHAFVGAVCMAGVQPGLWGVEGGNKLVVEEILQQNNINVISADVDEINLNQDPSKGKYTVKTKTGTKTQEKQYDIVIIATPLQDKISGIKFKNFPKPIHNFSHHYHRTVANFYAGFPNISHFGISDLYDFPTALLSVNPELFFNSIGHQSPVDWSSEEGKNSPVYKVFSSLPLTKDQSDVLFTSKKEEKVIDWMAYPSYSSNEENIPPFKLYDQLYYANAIEIAASAMEMAVIGGKNVALLAKHEWENNMEKINNPNLLKDNSQKSEL